MKQWKSNFIEEFNEKYETDVKFEDIVNDEAFQERLQAANGYKELYKKKLKQVINKVKIIFSVMLLCIVSLAVCVVLDISRDNQVKNIDELLSTEEKSNINSYNNLKVINEITLDQFYDIYLLKTLGYNQDNKDEIVYTYYYKIFLENDTDTITLFIDGKEHLVTNQNPFGVFYSVSKKEDELVTVEFKFEYLGLVKSYQFEDAS